MLQHYKFKKNFNYEILIKKKYYSKFRYPLVINDIN